ncbi:MAG: autotransporter outer membrane beta-barrel domain-containing protein [Rhizobiales bacterium]|nr:autotransporter outer membrane beta-barrel domain-containing protein [Hyphomicrobiales bacterium]
MSAKQRDVSGTGDGLSRSKDLNRSPRLERFLLSVSSIALVQAMLLSPAAAQHTWHGSQDSNWANGANWTPAAPGGPTTGAVHIGQSGPPAVNPVISSDVPTLNGSVNVGTSAQLTIQGGGSLALANAADSVSIGGGSPPAIATVTVTGPGSLLQGNGGSVVVGVAAPAPAVLPGAFNVLDGAQVTGFRIDIGLDSRTVGHAVVSGAGSNITVVNVATNPWVSVGFSGTGTLEISDGGTVTSPIAQIATNATGHGTVNVTDPGSTWTVEGTVDFHVGGAGTGILNIFNGGVVQADFASISIGASSDGTGTVRIDGAGSTLHSGVGLNVGGGTGPTAGAGTGFLTITNGGTASTTGPISIGNLGGSGTVTVDGAGSTLSAGGDINVGNVGDGTLTVSNGGNVTAGGTLWIARGLSEGTLNIGAAPGDPAAAPGTVNAAGIQFGIGDGVINFNHTSSDYVFAPAISGPGAVNQLAGTTVLTAANTYTGPTTISGGTLRVNGSITSPTTVNAGGTLGGTGTIFNDVTNAGIVAPGPGPSGFGALTITGAYVGNGGTLAIKTALGNDGSPTDQLILQGAGASASGTTSIQVTNVGGTGAETTNGIPIVVTQNGATTTPTAFQLGGPVAAGAFQYLLFQGLPNGGSADEQNTWYLRSSLINPGPGPNPNPPIPLYRPEVPLYASLAGIARNLTMTTIGTFHERNGDQGLVRGNGTSNGASDRAWGRLFGQSLEQSHTGTVSGRFDGNAGGVQSGLDLYRTTAPDGYQSRLGFLGGYGRARGDVNGFALGQQNAFAGRLELDAYSVGGYWTQVGVPGWYLDAVVMGTRYESTGTSTNQVGIRVSGHSVAGSLEAGYPIPLGGGVHIEPQAQLVYQHLDFNDTRDRFSSVDFDASNSLSGRLGLRLAGNTLYGAARVRPYLKASVWHDWTGTDKITFAGADVIEARFRGTALEVGAGIVAELTNTVGLWAVADYTTDIGGDQDREAIRGNVGVRWVW